MRIQRKRIPESSTRSDGRMLLHFLNSFLYWLQVETPDLYAQIVLALKVAYLNVTDEDDGDEGMDEAMCVARPAPLFASSRTMRGRRCPSLEAEAKSYVERAKSKESCATNLLNPVSLAASDIEKELNELRMIQRKFQMRLDKQAESKHRVEV